jgi:hypothetical protein
MAADRSRSGVAPGRLILFCALPLGLLLLLGAGALCAHAYYTFHPAGAVRETRTGLWLCQVPDRRCGELRAR